MNLLWHTPTLMFNTVLVTATLALCLGLVQRRAAHDGLFAWALALAVHSCAYVLFILRGEVSPWLSVVLANVLIACVYALMLEALYQFQQRRPQRLWIWLPVLLTAAGFVVLVEQPRARVVFSASLLGLQGLQFVWTMAQRWHDTPGRGKYFLLLGLALTQLALTLRAGAIVAGDFDAHSIRQDHPLQALLFNIVLVANILTNFGIVVMTKERADARNQRLAYSDELTGLHNRRHLQSTLQQQLAQAQRSEEPLSLLLIDIYFFKHINDQHGHLSGDLVLRALAHTIRAQLREQDIAGRWGGEEFMLLLPATDRSGALVLAERLRAAVQEHPFRTESGVRLQVTISLGVQTWYTQGALPLRAETLVSQADQALYQAKAGGRNRVACATA